MKRLIPALLALLFAWTAAPARDISGRVLLRDSCIVAGDFVMIYCKEYGTGTLSDEDGRFCLHLPSGEAKLQLEFSRIGYTTVFREINLPSGEYNIGAYAHCGIRDTERNGPGPVRAFQSLGKRQGKP